MNQRCNAALVMKKPTALFSCMIIKMTKITVFQAFTQDLQKLSTHAERVLHTENDLIYNKVRLGQKA